jgi:hypothetical protein
VSLRSRDDIYLRHARDGFWVFPGEKAWPAPEGVIRAALRTAVELPPEQALRQLDGSAIAVTFFSALEACAVGELDNDRYGIVVRSLERPGWMGGALPRMPGILNEWAQYQHARITNAQLVSFEPHEILRHDVVKVVEPGTVWQPTGVPAPDEPHPLRQASCGAPVPARARDLALARLFGGEPKTAPLADDLLPGDVDSLYVSVYLRGRLRGCFGSSLHRLDDDVSTLVDAALGDARFEAQQVTAADDVAVSVALLYDRLALGIHSVDDIIRRIRYGEHALMVEQGNRFALFLPSIVSRYNLDPVAFVEELIAKAEITRRPYRWIRFECATWLADRDGERLMEGSFALAPSPRELPTLVQRFVPLAVDYLLRHQKPDGTFYTRYDPLQDQLYSGVDLPRLAHAAWVLARAAKSAGAPAGGAAARTTTFLLGTVKKKSDEFWFRHDDNEQSVAEIALTTLALCEANGAPAARWVPKLAGALWSRIDVHGCVHTHRDAELADDAFQDYFPGQVLLALGHAAQARLTAVDDTKLGRAFRYYRDRFRNRPHFGQVSWLAQMCNAWGRLTGEPCYAELAFEVADWILRYQQQKTGAFINDHQSDTPGYTSALYVEGIAAAAALARDSGDAPRQRRYLEACRHGLQFLDGLIIQPRDATVVPDPAMAIGGLRRSSRRSEIYLDFVQHYLAAALETDAASRSE